MMGEALYAVEGFHMEEFMGSDENYLEAIYVLAEKGKTPVRIVDVAAYLGYTPPSVSRAIMKLKKRGFLQADETNGLLLTESGRQNGRWIYEKDCFFYQALVRIGVEPAEAAQNAYRLKRAVSPQCYEKLCLVFPEEASEAQKRTSGDMVLETRRKAVLPGRACADHNAQREGWQGTWNELVEAAQNHINENYMHKFSLQNIADAIHVNPCYLERVFREATGQTLLTFHNSTRCKVARRLLESSRLNITEISSQVGFVSPAHFSRVFRKVEGQSPSEYRRCLDQFEAE